MVVLLGTALETVFTPFKRFDFEHIIFMCITPFAVFVKIPAETADAKNIYNYI
jgi:hypothetical protein